MEVLHPGWILQMLLDQQLKLGQDLTQVQIKIGVGTHMIQERTETMLPTTDRVLTKAGISLPSNKTKL